MTDEQRKMLEEGCAQLESRAGLVWGPEYIEEFAAAIRAALAEIDALKAHDPLAAMWAALAEYQPQADRDGHGESWAAMCRARTEDAARAAAAAAEEWAFLAADAAAAALGASMWAGAAIASICRAKEVQR